MTITAIKVIGPTLLLTATGNNVATASEAGSANGATMVYVVFVGAAGTSSNVSVSNNGANVGNVVVLSGTSVTIRKYAGDLLYSANVTNVYATPVSQAYA